MGLEEDTPRGREKEKGRRVYVAKKEKRKERKEVAKKSEHGA